MEDSSGKRLCGCRLNTIPPRVFRGRKNIRHKNAIVPKRLVDDVLDKSDTLMGQPKRRTHKAVQRKLDHNVIEVTSRARVLRRPCLLSVSQQQQHRRPSSGAQQHAPAPRLRDREHRSESGGRRSLERSVGLDLADGSPPSDHFLYDNLCYATTPPSSSNETSSDEGGGGADRGDRSDRASGLATPRRQASHEESPTSKLLMEYETHLRNALARGMDAESYSLHTFEALLTQSMENVGE
ncbi:hypothetical protein HPB48_015377 [Haemaphysalis longicornis]|uniref:Uncharacterized protein n=1 Tax=Haemaphysalis longicornis TaxID=44386 RepID=A0A9J6H548_HAELO|nr:hypothetical protein HPB48_015377 [Haemaphysalis longicornis]